MDRYNFVFGPEGKSAVKRTCRPNSKTGIVQTMSPEFSWVGRFTS